jgi:type II secretory pathway component PulC
MFVACGGNLMDEPVEAPTKVAEEPVKQAPKPPPGSLFRKDVNATVEEGLGYFLQRVSVDPEIVGGKFQGFRIVELRPVEFWQGVDLKPGDVVTKVNGQSIERDIDAYQAFQGLLAAPSLKVSFVRSGSPRELVFAIVDDGTKTAAPKAAPPSAPSAPPAPAQKPAG